jgi:hypothetical protein
MWLTNEMNDAPDWPRACNEAGLDPDTADPADVADALCAAPDDEVLDCEEIYQILQTVQSLWQNGMPVREEYARDNGMHDGFDAR